MVDSNDDGVIVNPGLGQEPRGGDHDEPADEVDEANELRLSEEEQLIREQSGEARENAEPGVTTATED